MGKTTPDNAGNARPQADVNEGEGNRTADRNYRKATEEFVNSERGQREIRKAGDVTPDQERDIRQAEEQAKSHAREHDPEEVRDSSRPA